MKEIAFTDYPFIELGDLPNKLALIRQVHPVYYDGDKCVYIEFEGKGLTVKSEYLYTQQGRKEENLPLYPVNNLPILEW